MGVLLMQSMLTLEFHANVFVGFAAWGATPADIGEQRALIVHDRHVVNPVVKMGRRRAAVLPHPRRTARQAGNVHGAARALRGAHRQPYPVVHQVSTATETHRQG